jgi:hypothetical protein
MCVRDKLHAPAVLFPHVEPLVTIAYECDWAPGLVWLLRKRQPFGPGGSRIAVIQFLARRYASSSRSYSQ